MTAPDEDRRREDFIRETAKAMREAEIISLSNRDEVTDWLRTVWHEALGEPWGEGAEHAMEDASSRVCEECGETIPDDEGMYSVTFRKKPQSVCSDCSFSPPEDTP